jgi:hypothetical protein
MRASPCYLQVYGYLKAYAAIFQLEQHVQFQTQVVRAVPVATLPSAVTGTPAQPSNGSSSGVSTSGAHATSKGAVGSCDIPPSEQRWQVTIAPAHRGKSTAGAATRPDTADNQITSVFDALVVCNGHFSEPRLPDAAGDLPASYIG